MSVQQRDLLSINLKEVELTQYSAETLTNKFYAILRNRSLLDVFLNCN